MATQKYIYINNIRNMETIEVLKNVQRLGG